MDDHRRLVHIDIWWIYECAAHNTRTRLHLNRKKSGKKHARENSAPNSTAASAFSRSSNNNDDKADDYKSKGATNYTIKFRNKRERKKIVRTKVP